jgi:hypothetical protein
MTRLMIRLALSTIAAAALAAWVGDRLLSEDPPSRSTVVVEPLARPAAERAVEVPDAPRAMAAGAVEAATAPREVPDSWVHEAVADVVTHPMATRLLVGDRLAERVVAAIDAVAGGYPIRAPQAPIALAGPFLVRPSAAGLVIAESSYRRFDLAVDLLSAVDMERAASRYREVSPALERIYRERSWYRSSFEDRLAEAIDHLLAVEVPDGTPAVRRDGLWWEFEDDDLARLTGAQRQLLRLGPDNARRVQSALGRMRRALTGDGAAAAVGGERAARAEALSDLRRDDSPPLDAVAAP